MTECKHDWHFIWATDRLQCARCKAETGPRTYDQLTRDMFEDITVPTEQMQQYKLHDSRPNSILFFGAVNDQRTEVMRIYFQGRYLGQLRMMVDRAINEEIEACAAIAHEAEPYQAADLIRKRKRP